jgi:hypothetical protein
MSQETGQEQSEQQARIETWRLKTQETVDELCELAEMDFFGIGDRYGLEQMLEEPLDWGGVDKTERESLLKGVGSTLGVNLLTFTDNDVLRTYDEEGVPEIETETGAKVSVLATKVPELEVHIMRYNNPSLGTRYDLVRTESTEG